MVRFVNPQRKVSLDYSRWLAQLLTNLRLPHYLDIQLGPIKLLPLTITEGLRFKDNPFESVANQQTPRDRETRTAERGAKSGGKRTNRLPL
jgi:hypothetical protein